MKNRYSIKIWIKKKIKITKVQNITIKMCRPFDLSKKEYKNTFGSGWLNKIKNTYRAKVDGKKTVVLENLFFLHMLKPSVQSTGTYEGCSKIMETGHTI